MGARPIKQTLEQEKETLFAERAGALVGVGCLTLACYLFFTDPAALAALGKGQTMLQVCWIVFKAFFIVIGILGLIFVALGVLSDILVAIVKKTTKGKYDG